MTIPYSKIALKLLLDHGFRHLDVAETGRDETNSIIEINFDSKNSIAYWIASYHYFPDSTIIEMIAKLTEHKN